MLCNMRCQRECRVKSTLCTQGQEQRRQTIQKELKAGIKNDLKTAWIYPRSSGSTAPPQHTTPHEPLGVVGVILSLHHTFDMLLQTDLFITRLPCVEPCVSEHVPWHLVPTVDQSATPHSECVISSSIAGPPVLRASPRLSGFKLVSTRCTLEFWLSVRDDLNHSRRTQPVVHHNRSSRPVVSVAAGPLTQVTCATQNANLDRPTAILQPALFKHSCISL